MKFGPRDRFIRWLHRLIREPVTIAVEWQGAFFVCGFQRCVIIPPIPAYLLQPSLTVVVPLARRPKLTCWWPRPGRYTLVRTVADHLGLLPRMVRPMNCVQATASFLRLKGRYRRPHEILAEIT